MDELLQISPSPPFMEVTMAAVEMQSDLRSGSHHNSRTVNSVVPVSVPPLVSVQGTSHGLRLFSGVNDETALPGQSLIVDETKTYMDCLGDEDDDSDGGRSLTPSRNLDGEPLTKKTRGRVKIKMQFIQNKLRRYTTFSKRKTGIMKKAYELSTLTGTQVMLLVASETGHVYTFATRKLQPMITSESGKALIQTCLNSPDPTPYTTQPTEQRMSQTGYEEPDLQYTTNEDGTKCNLSPAAQASMVGLPLGQGGQTFPMTTYIAPPTPQSGTKSSPLPVTYSVQPVAGGNLTTIFTPAAGNLPAQTSLQIQPTPPPPPPPPPPQPTNQVLSGQLQLHRIHPHNIVLTGNSTNLQSGQLIINQAQNNGSTLPVVIAPDQNHSGHVATSSSSQTTSDQDSIITIVQPSGDHNFSSNSNPVQMVYNQSGGVLYATPVQTINNSDRESAVIMQTSTPQNSVAVHHPTIIHTSNGTYQLQHDGTAGLIDTHHPDNLRHIVDGTFVISSDNHQDLTKPDMTTNT